MISFYPGPSRVYDQIPKWVAKAHKQGILGINHRSGTFETLVDRTISSLRKKLDLPAEYICLFTSSATECWEIVAQSLINRSSFHMYNGAFGKKWFDYTQKLNPDAEAWEFPMDTPLNVEEIPVTEHAELIALTQNETSNGTHIISETLSALRKRYPQKLIAVDATSSLGGVFLKWKDADVWFASVQKCLGLPAGMGLLICSPEAVARSERLGDHKHYNSLNNLVDHMNNHQTTHTPNVLSIYLLAAVMKKVKPIKVIHEKLIKRNQQWISFIASLKSLEPLIPNDSVRSTTVIALKGHPGNIGKVLSQSQKAGFIIGKGYGDLKSTTLRIANFPALRNREIAKLQKFWQKQGY